MICSIKHKGLRRFHEEDDASKIDSHHRKRLRLILTALEAAHEAEDMRFPGSDFHALQGKLKGFWSVSVSGNWRVTFRFDEGDVYEVDYVDYH